MKLTLLWVYIVILVSFNSVGCRPNLIRQCCGEGYTFAARPGYICPMSSALFCTVPCVYSEEESGDKCVEN